MIQYGKEWLEQKIDSYLRLYKTTGDPCLVPAIKGLAKTYIEREGKPYVVCWSDIKILTEKELVPERFEEKTTLEKVMTWETAR